MKRSVVALKAKECIVNFNGEEMRGVISLNEKRVSVFDNEKDMIGVFDIDYVGNLIQRADKYQSNNIIGKIKEVIKG